jgi:short-subunit dehydrogenase
MNLKDKVIVITGASYGLGKEIVLKLAEDKPKIVLLARNEERLQKVSEVLNKDQVENVYYSCDVGDESKVKDAINKAVEKFGKIDILINNAGQWFEGNLETHEEKVIKELFTVNAIGPILMSKAVLPFMKQQNSGTILNIISIAGVETPGDHGIYSVYTATKFAETGFTLSLREELKSTGIKVLSFCPSGMNTEIFDRAGFHYDDINEWTVDKKEIAEIIKFILSRPEDIAIDQLIIHKFIK